MDTKILKLASCLILFLITYVCGQRPSLNLFESGGDEANVFVPVGSGDPFSLRLATNPTGPLISDPHGELNSIGVMLNGANEDTNVERIEVDLAAIPRTGILVTVTGQRYQIQVGGGPASVANYSALLSTLVYISNLTTDALADTPRNITIIAIDDVGQSEPAVANIQLVPFNLGPPVFSTYITEVQVAENTPNGGLVTTINVTDPDGLIVRVSFAEPSSIFSIDRRSREVRVLDTSALDYEDVDNRTFELNLIATDTDPVEPLSSTAMLIITLTNANDNAPVFSSPTYTFSVVEEAVNAEVGTVMATDADRDTLFYDFVSVATGSTFLLNRETGVITVRTSLDFEAQISFQFQIVVTDGLSSGTADITVNVIDITDNRPVVSPAEKSIIINLDVAENEISLTRGTGGPLAVSDDSAALVGGSASILVSRSGVEETFPNLYGECECTDQACGNVFSLCNASFSLQQDLFAGASAIPGGPSLISGLNNTAYSFNGRDDLNNNWLSVSESSKNLFLQTTDNFTISFWIRVEENSNAAYILTFELGTSRYFSLYDVSSERLNLYYFRDNLPNVAIMLDDARNTQVSLSFYYSQTLLPNGLRDGMWHFMSMTVNFPSVVLSIDGFEHRPTRGNYRNEFQSTINLNLLTDGTFYEMPAPILTKDAAQLSSIEGRIGGSARGDTFTVFGEMRQVVLSDIIDTSTYVCLASCNNRIDVDPASTIGSSFETRYNPVSRVLFFTGAVAPSQYTILLQSLIYYSNGFLPPEEQGERRIVRIQVEDEVGFGNTAVITITGRSNQNVPVFDANGDNVDGIDFSVSFVEGEDTRVSILSPQAFISDDDIESRIDWVTVSIIDRGLNLDHEFLNLVDVVPSGLSVVFGLFSSLVNISAADPVQATTNAFITALLSVRYNFRNLQPNFATRTVEFTIFDGLHTNSPRARTTITVFRIDDPPSADLNGGLPGTNGRQEYVESSPPTSILLDLNLIDPGSFSSITEARVRIDTVFDMGNESIALDSTLLPPGVTCSPASCNGTDIVISGSSQLTDYRSLLQSLQYVNLQQSTDLPNLRDRIVYVTVSDGVSTSDPDANVVIDITPVNPRVIIELAAPNQNFVTTFEEDQLNPIPCSSIVRVVDTSIETLESIVVSIRDNLPAGVEEDLEMITVTSVTGLDMSIEINPALKRITFSQVAPLDQYVEAIRRVRYFNGENEPYQINRFVDFLVVPGGGAPNDTAFCSIEFLNTIMDHTSSPATSTDLTSGSTTEGSTSAPLNCEASNITLQLCEALSQDPETLAETLVNITSNREDIQPEELTVAITVLENLTMEAITEENTEIRENYLQVVDELIQVDSEVIMQSQNASGRLLTILADFADNVQLPNDTNNATFTQQTFAIRVTDIDRNQYNGETVTVDFEESITGRGDVLSSSVITSMPGTSHNISQNVTAAVRIPMSIFEELGLNNSNNSNVQRLSFSVFTQGNLFQSTQDNQSNLTLGSIVVAVRVNGTESDVEDTRLSTPIQVFFQPNQPIDNLTRTSCGVWQGEQSAWSMDVCTLVSELVPTGSSETEPEMIEVHYSQTGHFGFLLDLTYGLVEPLPDEFSFTLQIITYVGLTLSLLCLILFLLTYLTTSKLRTSGHGQILINMCLALMCVYIAFLLGAHAAPVPLFCRISAALLQYFLLAFFAWTAIEAFYLHRKLVKVLGSHIDKYALKAGLVAWLSPLIVVAISVGPGYKLYYHNSTSFCRARELPFWLGFILPFLIIYTFDWIVFCLIMISICRRRTCRETEKMTFFKQKVAIAMGLAVLFGLGWGFGLAASSTGTHVLTLIFQIIFSIFVGFQGVLIFALHCVNQSEARKQWMLWFSKITGQKPVTGLPKSAPSKHIATFPRCDLTSPTCNKNSSSSKELESITELDMTLNENEKWSNTPAALLDSKSAELQTQPQKYGVTYSNPRAENGTEELDNRHLTMI